MRQFKNIPILTGKEVKRFWSHINKGKNNTCWLNASNKKFALNGKRYHFIRILYSLSYPNEDISNKKIIHKCKNVSCLNPKHLFTSVYQHGILNSNVKLNDELVKEIRKKYKQGYTLTNLSIKYIRPLTTIFDVVNHITWKHL